MPDLSAAPLNPWDIREDETARAYAAFAVYRDAGAERSLEKTAQILNKSSRVLAEWSGKFAWVERSRAFDEYTAKLAADKSVEQHAEVRARQAGQAREIAGMAHGRLSKTTKADGTVVEFDPLDLTPAEAGRLWQAALREERDALGIATKTEVEMDVTLRGGLSDAERQALRAEIRETP